MRSDTGRRHHWWSTADIEFIRESAGRVPERQIRKELRVSREALRAAVRKMRAAGEDVDLRCHQSALVMCPECGARRSTFGRGGICVPCARRRQLAAIEGRAARLLAMLPPDERGAYADTEAERETLPGPKPVMPPTAGMTRYEREVAEDRYDRAMERWSADYWSRRCRAAQKRKERISEKLVEMRKDLPPEQNPSSKA